MLENGLREQKEPMEEAQRGSGMGTSTLSSRLVPGSSFLIGAAYPGSPKAFVLQVHGDGEITEPYEFLRGLPGPPHITGVCYN